MCGGFEHQHKNAESGGTETRKVFFPRPYAQAPIVKDGSEAFVQWGKRKGEDEAFDVPQTGWARLESLRARKWNRWKPDRVIIPVTQWMEKDKDRTSHWFAMEENTALLGALVEATNQETGEVKQFVYVVTEEPGSNFIHDRVPVIVDSQGNYLDCDR